jgi:excinuclease ABC subunit A
VIDLGPEGGDGGGTVVAAGTPEEIAGCEASHTGRYLARVLREPLTAQAAAASPRKRARPARAA